MWKMKVLLKALLLLSTSVSLVEALPTGAAGCTGGEAAIGGGHFASPPGDQGLLGNGGFVLSINGKPVTDPSTPVSLFTGLEYTISLSGADFLGFLFRLGSDSGMDTSDLMVPGDLGGAKFTSAGICPETVAGVTHSLNDVKTEATAVLNGDVVGTYTLDVTVVTRNCSPQSPVLGPPNDVVVPCTPAESTYFYTGYTLTLVEPTPTLVPTDGPSEIPTPAPSDGPSEVPTPVPSLEPSELPTPIPSDGPSEVPTPAPSLEPSEVPTRVPSLEPSKLPSSMPSAAPSTPEPSATPSTPAPSAAPTPEPPNVVMPSPDGEDCWSSSQDITFTEIDSIFDAELAASRRTYIICPNSTITIGVQQGENNFVGGEFPIAVFLPGLNIKCGDSGESTNKCILDGGQEQITSLSSTDFLESALAVLPIFIPGRSEYPSELPEDFEVDSTDLRVTGMTFEGFTNEDPGEVHSPLFLQAPGVGIIIKDCIFQNGDVQKPASSAIEATFIEELWSGKGSTYISMKIQDCLFKDNTFTKPVIVAGPTADAPQVKSGVMQTDIDSCLFENNIAQSAVHLALSDGSVMNSCFIDTATTAANSIVETLDSVDVEFENNFELRTVYAENVTCEGIAVYETKKDMLDLSVCIDFDAGICAVNGATGPPTPAPVSPAPVAPSESPSYSPSAAPSDSSESPSGTPSISPAPVAPSDAPVTPAPAAPSDAPVTPAPVTSGAASLKQALRLFVFVPVVMWAAVN